MPGLWAWPLGPSCHTATEGLDRPRFTHLSTPGPPPLLSPPSARRRRGRRRVWAWVAVLLGTCRGQCPGCQPPPETHPNASVFIWCSVRAERCSHAAANDGLECLGHPTLCLQQCYQMACCTENYQCITMPRRLYGINASARPHLVTLAGTRTGSAGRLCGCHCYGEQDDHVWRHRPVHDFCAVSACMPA